MEEPASPASENGLDNVALSRADNTDVAWPSPAAKREMQDDFAEAVAQIVEAFDGYTKANALDHAAIALGVNAAQWLFIGNPLGLGPDTEDRTRCIVFLVDSLIGNPVFARQQEETRASGLAIDTFGSAFDEMVAAFAAMGGRA